MSPGKIALVWSVAAGIGAIASYGWGLVEERRVSRPAFEHQQAPPPSTAMPSGSAQAAPLMPRDAMREYTEQEFASARYTPEQQEIIRRMREAAADLHERGRTLP